MAKYCWIPKWCQSCASIFVHLASMPESGVYVSNYMRDQIYIIILFRVVCVLSALYRCCRIVQHHKSLDINFWVCYVKSLRKELAFAVAAAVAATNFHISHFRCSCAFELPTDRTTDRRTERRKFLVFFTPLPFFVLLRRRLHTHTYTCAHMHSTRNTRNSIHVATTPNTLKPLRPIHAQRIASLVLIDTAGCLASTHMCNCCYRLCCRRLLFFVWFMGG